MPMVRLENATVLAGQMSILGPLSLTVERGEFLGIVGPNGAGKSTLLRLLAGMAEPDSGHIAFFEGDEREGHAVTAALRRRSIGLLFQHHHFNPDLPFTVEDVVYFGRAGLRAPGKRYGKRDARAVQAALASLELKAMRRQPYRELSGGERQKTQLARLVAQQPRLLLLDEPSAGLDLDWQERLTRLVAQLYSEEKRTIVMVTHDVDHLPECCSRVLLMKKGRLQASGTPEQVFQPDILSDLYDCAMEVVWREGRCHAFSTGARGGRP